MYANQILNQIHMDIIKNAIINQELKNNTIQQQPAYPPYLIPNNMVPQNTSSYMDQILKYPFIWMSFQAKIQQYLSSLANNNNFNPINAIPQDPTINKPIYPFPQLNQYNIANIINTPSISPVQTVSSDNLSVEDYLSNSSPSKSCQQQSTTFTCPHCQKCYTTENGLYKHITLNKCLKKVEHETDDMVTDLSMKKDEITPVQQVKKYSCNQCSKCYDSQSALKMHVRTHTLPCKCERCGKAFSRMWLLTGHMRTHTGEKPFVCDICSRAFADRSNLRAHQQTHTKDKRYLCQCCQKTFSRMGLLNKHKSTCTGIIMPNNNEQNCQNR